MKVKELIAALANEDAEAEVHFAYDYGDRSHTTVAPKVRRVEPATVRWSDYHRSPSVIEDEDAEGASEVVVLR